MRENMRKAIGKRVVCQILLLAVFVVCLSGCSTKNSELTITGFAFDTTYTITFYQGGSQELLDSCVEKCSSYETIFSRTQLGSELYQINEIQKLYASAIEQYDKENADNGGKRKLQKIIRQLEQMKPESNQAEYEIAEDGSISFSVSDMMRDIIKKGLWYCEESEGRFDITIEPVSSLWDFKSENPKVPDEKKIEEALPYVDYKKVSLDGNSLVFAQAGMGLDLGGIAKGFIADDLKAYLVQQGVSGATINLGGNVLCIGEKSDGQNFLIGVQQPFAERNETAAAVSVKDMSVVSSGTYERYFTTEDGTLYHHILNPKTGYSYDNDLSAVTILSKQSVDGDGLSTTCFAMGKDEGIRYVNSLDDVYAMFITKDNEIYYSNGFENFLPN